MPEKERQRVDKGMRRGGVDSKCSDNESVPIGTHKYARATITMAMRTTMATTAATKIIPIMTV